METPAATAIDVRSAEVLRKAKFRSVVVRVKATVIAAAQVVVISIT